MGLESPEPAPTKDIDSGADRRISGAPKTVRRFGSFGTPPVREYAEPSPAAYRVASKVST